VGPILSQRAAPRSVERRDRRRASASHSPPSVQLRTPGSEMAARILTAVTLDTLPVTAETVRQIRIAGLIVMLAGSAGASRRVKQRTAAHRQWNNV
jgi:hypothetical protein